MFSSKKQDVSNTLPDDKNTTQNFEIPSVVFAVAEKMKGNQMLNDAKSNAVSGEEPTVLSSGTSFKGVLTSPGPVHAKGELDGEFSAPHFTLSNSGRLKGKLTCKKLMVDGELEGDLVCEEAVAGAQAILSGNIVCKSLQAAPGAAINGKIDVGADVNTGSATAQY